MCVAAVGVLAGCGGQGPAVESSASISTPIRAAAEGCGITGGQIAQDGSSVLMSDPILADCVAKALNAPADVKAELAQVDASGERSWASASVKWSKHGRYSHYGFAMAGAKMPDVADAKAEVDRDAVSQRLQAEQQAKDDAWAKVEAEHVSSAQADEAAFAQAIGESTEDAEYSIKGARAICERVRSAKDKTDRGRARLILEDAGAPDDLLAVGTHLCKDMTKAFDLAQRGFDDGTYEVGGRTAKVDAWTIRAGTYRTDKRISDCYWERSTSGGSTIANDFVTNAPGGVTVTIRKGEGFKSERCGTWLPVQ